MSRSTAAASLPSTRTVDWGTMAACASSMGIPLCSRAVRTASISSGVVVISKTFSTVRTSEAPASSACSSTSSSLTFSASTWITPRRSNIQATQPAVPMRPLCFSKMCLISGPVRFLLSVSTRTSTATPPGPYPSYVISSNCSPGPPPVPFSMARLTLSAGMLAALADSIAALSRMLALGSPPPCLAATVISRRIFEKSFPRCTSALPFFRLIWDHRECPDIPSPSLLNGCFEPLHALPPTRPAFLGLGPAPLLARRLGHEGRARPRPHVRAQVHEGEVRGAGVPHLPRPRHLGQDLHTDLQRRVAHLIERGLEGDHLVRRDGGVEVECVQARRHDVAPDIAHGQDAARLVDVHEELAGEHGVPEDRVLRQHRTGRFKRPAELLLTLVAPFPGCREQRLLCGGAGGEGRGHRRRLQVVVDLDEDQVRVERLGAEPGGNVLGED